MYLCYFDESGDSGYYNSLTKSYTLACLLIHDSRWLAALDDTIRFRRFLRDTFGLQMRDELKAGYLIHNNGPFLKLRLGDKARMRIYTMALRLLAKLADGQGVRTFAVSVDKEEMKRRDLTDDPQEVVWERAIERLERFTFYEQDSCVMFPDEGNYDLIRAILRKKRRFSYVPSRYGTEPLRRPASFILEDPSSRRSQESYFVQLADLLAYAAHRVIYAEPWFGSTYWENAGTTRISEVNKYSGGPTGIVVWPPLKTK